MGPFSICVTVGTLNRQFNRLLRFLADTPLENCSGLIQFGGSDPDLVNRIAGVFHARAFVADKDLDDAILKSDLVISHAGVGSIIKANQLNRPLILLPRLQKYGEHFDDHQLQIAQVVRHISGITVCGDSEEDFRTTVIHSLAEPPDVESTLGGDELPAYLKGWVERARDSK
ncbi:glycosyltransferase [Bradyrhizobium liaoningense]